MIPYCIKKGVWFHVDNPIKYSVDTVLKFCHECDIYIEHNEKNDTFKRHSGATTEDLENVIRTLEARHLSKDPFLAKDKRYKGHYLYEFKKMAFDKYWAYIKVFIREFNDEKKVVVAVSLHESDNTNYEV